MKNALRAQSRSKWLPILALPIFIIVFYLILLPFATPFAGRAGFLPWTPVSMLLGGFLALFFLHFVLFFVLPYYKANLAFSLLGLVWLFRESVQVLKPLSVYFNQQTVFITTYLSALAVPIVSLLFVYIVCKLFPGILQKWFIYVACILMVLFSVSLFIFSGEYANLALTICTVALFPAALYFAIRLIVKLECINPEHVMFFVGAALLLIGVLLSLPLFGDDPPLFLRYISGNFMLIFSFFTSSALILATIRGVLDSNAESHRLDAMGLITEYQLTSQREQYKSLMENMESVRFMRHDMKHHLAVISEYVQSENISGIRGYMEGLEYGLNSARSKFYCDNYAVNAIVNHYIDSAGSDGIPTTVKLTVPAEAGQIRDSDLCIVFGNLLENAVDACRGLPSGDRFIRIFSYISDGGLVVTMENSFDGKLKERNGTLLSTKHDGDGIGLSSVHVVSEKYNGDMRIETRDRVFLSSVYLSMFDN